MGRIITQDLTEQSRIRSQDIRSLILVSLIPIEENSSLEWKRSVGYDPRLTQHHFDVLYFCYNTFILVACCVLLLLKYLRVWYRLSWLTWTRIMTKQVSNPCDDVPSPPYHTVWPCNQIQGFNCTPRLQLTPSHSGLPLPKLWTVMEPKGACSKGKLSEIVSLGKIHNRTIGLCDDNRRERSTLHQSLHRTRGKRSQDLDLPGRVVILGVQVIGVDTTLALGCTNLGWLIHNVTLIFRNGN